MIRKSCSKPLQLHIALSQPNTCLSSHLIRLVTCQFPFLYQMRFRLPRFSLVEIPFHALHFVVILLEASCLVMILWEHLHDPLNHRLFWFVMVTRTRTSQTLSQPLMRRTPMSFASCPSRISPSPKSRLIAFPRAQNERHGVAAAALSLGLHRNITHLLPVFYWLLSLEPHTSH